MVKNLDQPFVYIAIGVCCSNITNRGTDYTTAISKYDNDIIQNLPYARLVSLVSEHAEGPGGHVHVAGDPL